MKRNLNLIRRKNILKRIQRIQKFMRIIFIPHFYLNFTLRNNTIINLILITKITHIFLINHIFIIKIFLNNRRFIHITINITNNIIIIIIIIINLHIRKITINSFSLILNNKLINQIIRTGINHRRIFIINNIQILPPQNFQKIPFHFFLTNRATMIF